MNVSVVIPVYNSVQTLPILVDDLSSLREVTEIILVNDGSSDEVAKFITSNLQGNPKIVFIDLFRNFGQLAAISAGMHYANGDYVVIMDDDLQHPVNQIPKLLKSILEGYDFVFALPIEAIHPRNRKLGSRLNRKLMQWANGQSKSLEVSSFYVVTQEVAKYVAKYQGPFPYISGRIFSLTHFGINIKVEMNSRNYGKSNYTLQKLAKQTFNGLFNYSLRPLRLAIFAGIFISSLAFISITYLVLRYLIYKSLIIPGWTSIIISYLFFSGLQLIFFGLIGEYVGRIFIAQGQYPQYEIRSIRMMGKE